ncbi:hypothetical protein AKJ16_DCAP07072, partial [Drosera capensis]
MPMVKEPIFCPLLSVKQLRAKFTTSYQKPILQDMLEWSDDAVFCWILVGLSSLPEVYRRQIQISRQSSASKYGLKVIGRPNPNLSSVIGQQIWLKSHRPAICLSNHQTSSAVTRPRICLVLV